MTAPRRDDLPRFLRPGAPLAFPDPARATADGLVAIGGDLSAERLLTAYDAGIFPCFAPGDLPLWWSPDPRAVLEPQTLHVSRRLERRLRQGGFALSFDRAFADVMRACAERRTDGDWIGAEMLAAYTRLHELGHAHSVEVLCGGTLAGGLYGVRRGGLFAAESMFHRMTDGSKIALVAAVRSLFRAGIRLFDVQYRTPHLAAMGATEWPRRRYLDRLAEVRGLDFALTIDLSPFGG